MKRKSILLMSVILCISTIAQNDQLTLYQLTEKKKTVRIKKDAIVVLISKTLFSADSVRERTIIGGKFISVMNDSIYMHVKKIDHSRQSKDGFTEVISNYQGPGCDPEYFKFDNIALESLASIRYHNKNGQVFTKIGSYTLSASAIFTFVVAPLVSIDYKNGEFDLDRYKNCVIAGAVGIGISIPILVFSRSRYVAMNDEQKARRMKIYTYKK